MTEFNARERKFAIGKPLATLWYSVPFSLFLLETFNIVGCIKNLP